MDEVLRKVAVETVERANGIEAVEVPLLNIRASALALLADVEREHGSLPGSREIFQGNYPDFTVLRGWNNLNKNYTLEVAEGAIPALMEEGKKNLNRFFKKWAEERFPKETGVDYAGLAEAFCVDYKTAKKYYNGDGSWRKRQLQTFRYLVGDDVFKKVVSPDEERQEALRNLAELLEQTATIDMVADLRDLYESYVLPKHSRHAVS